MKPPASAALASAVIAEVAARELWMAGWLQARTLAVVSAEHAVQPSSNASGALQECMAGRHARVGSIDFDRTLAHYVGNTRYTIVDLRGTPHQVLPDLF